MFLVGDIGGTNSRLGFFSEKAELLVQKKYSSKNFSEFGLIVKQFLDENRELKPQFACFGIAGPIQDGVCQATNLPWKIESAVLERDFDIKRVFLLNDLLANAWGIEVLKKDEIVVLNEGVIKSGNRALISAGTGLGEAGFFFDGKTHHPFATEGGHSDFSARNEKETRLLLFLKKRFAHVSWERILSGNGLFQIYSFLVEEEKLTPNLEVSKSASDPAKLITDFALESKCMTCLEAVRFFIALYGAESGNLALKMLAVNGVFIGGGIAPKLVKFLEHGPFMENFVSKGRFQNLLSSIPVKVLLNENTALLGACHYAQEHVSK